MLDLGPSHDHRSGQDEPRVVAEHAVSLVLDPTEDGVDPVVHVPLLWDLDHHPAPEREDVENRGLGDRGLPQIHFAPAHDRQGLAALEVGRAVDGLAPSQDRRHVHPGPRIRSQRPGAQGPPGDAPTDEEKNQGQEALEVQVTGREGQEDDTQENEDHPPRPLSGWRHELEDAEDHEGEGPVPEERARVQDPQVVESQHQPRRHDGQPEDEA